MYFVLKALFSGFIIALVTKMSDKMPVGGALIKSLPLTSLIVFFVMKFENKNNSEIASMSWDIFWMVIPSLILFALLPVLLNKGLSFYPSLLVATVVMSLGYLLMFKIIS